MWTEMVVARRTRDTPREPCGKNRRQISDSPSRRPKTFSLAVKFIRPSAPCQAFPEKRYVKGRPIQAEVSRRAGFRPRQGFYDM